MAVEVALVGLIGSGASLIGTNEKSVAKLFRRGLSGWALAFFGGQDLAALIAYLFTFEVSQGACVFFTGYCGAAFLDRIITLINALSFRSVSGDK
jgi:hypothetical protein